jgi:hypothetical protein
MSHLRKLLLGCACIAALGAPGAASAGIIPLDTFITGSGFGSTPPTGTVTITDIGSNVRVDFSVTSGDVAALYFNLVDDFDFDSLFLGSVSTSPGSPLASLIDGPQAPSNLDFDFGVDFGTGSSPGNLVTSGSFVLGVQGLNLSQPSFYQTSTNAGGTSTVTVGARLQSLGPRGGGSATIGGNPGGSSSGGTPVPAPAAAPLMALGLGLLGWRFGGRRRRLG